MVKNLTRKKIAALQPPPLVHTTFRHIHMLIFTGNLEGGGRKYPPEEFTLKCDIIHKDGTPIVGWSINWSAKIQTSIK